MMHVEVPVWWKRLAVLCLAAGFVAAGPAMMAQGSGSSNLRQRFLDPPDDSRIMMRWWWFGPAATKPEITRELEAMKAGGIGGVEVANLYALALDDTQKNFHNTPFLSPEHLEALRFANEEARRLGLRFDVTLGSGWPFGGPHIPVTEAAGKLRVEPVEVEPGAATVKAPFIDAGEELLAAFLAKSAAEAASAQPVSQPAAGWFQVSPSAEKRTLLCFISSRTGMMVKRPSVGASGFVLDPLDKAAIDTHLKAVGDKLFSAFGDHPPYAVFSDSLEIYGSDWSPRVLDEFARRRGYDLCPHLPALLRTADGGITPEMQAIRHDWGRTLTEMADANFLEPAEAWAKEHHTLFRSQTYGFPPVTLASNRIADLPEGEGKATFLMWREFSDTRWAASAGHLYHKPVISSETWTWLHSPAFRAAPLDMKAEADLHFLQGINQLVGHGWPYSPPGEPEPGWRMYAAAAFSDHNPWYFAMPELAKYLQRVSFALRQGEPANDVALLLPEDDAWASFSAGAQKSASPTSAAGFDTSGANVSIDDWMDKQLGKHVIAQVLDAGFNLDFIDGDAIDAVGIPYKVLILPSVDRLPAATYEKVLAFARKGGIVIATGRTPATAPGFLHAAEESARIREISQQLFQGNVTTAHFIEDDAKLGAELAKDAKPDLVLTPQTPEVGFIHRKFREGDLYFVANTSNETKHVEARFRDVARHAELWDGFTGATTGIANPNAISLDLEPYGSRLIFFSDTASAAPPEAKQSETVAADISSGGWRLHIGNVPEKNIDTLKSWTDLGSPYYSGTASYEKSFNAPAAGEGARLYLDFGKGRAEPLPSPPGQHNMLAYLDPPVHEAAQVFVNGKSAGFVWKPPYRVEVTGLVHPGTNELRVVVANTAINELAGQALPDYRLLWSRYGMLFVPQDMDKVVPVPSGLLGPVTLIESKTTK